MKLPKTDLLQRLVFKLIHRVLRNPSLSEHINRFLLRFLPGLHRHLFHLASQRGRFDDSNSLLKRPSKDELDLFVEDFLKITISTSLHSPMLDRYGQGIRKASERLASLAECEVNFTLITALRNGTLYQQRPFRLGEDGLLTRRLIQHMYLALRGKHPFPMEEDEALDALAHGKQFQELIADLKTFSIYKN